MTDTVTFGVELEWGDIDRRIRIPEELGDWDYCECDVVNTRHPYRGFAADPLGLRPPVGGEIKTVPATTPAALARVVAELRSIFEKAGCPPSVTCVAETHVHAKVPGLVESADALRKVARYVYAQQEDLFAATWKFEDDPRMSKFLRKFFKFDGARLMPDYMAANLLLVRDFEDFLAQFRKSRDGKTVRPVRYGVNLYCMKHIGTIEFRHFRATADPAEVADCVLFVRRFLEEALGDQKSVAQILSEQDWKFPPFVYDNELAHGWERSRWGKDRCAPKRRILRDAVA